MSRTYTTYVSFEELERRRPNAITVVQLMMACNDISIANHALSEWKKDQPQNKRSRQVGAGMYFIRTQLAHLHEGLKIVEKIRDDNLLMIHLGACDQKTKQSFQNLLPFLTDGSSRQEFEQLVGRVRHNLTFHYDESGKLIEKAICERASRNETRRSSVTAGTSGPLWYFRVADDIVNSIVVRQIWKVPRSADATVEADVIADRVHQICLWFLSFSHEFIWQYCRR